MDPFLLLLLIILATIVLHGARHRHRLSLPPGPKGLPLIGNLFDRPTRNAWLTYADWASTYDSDLLSIKVLGQPVIILNSIKAAVELFEERSTNYSDRPSFYMLRQLMEWKWSFGFMRYYDGWRYLPSILQLQCGCRLSSHPIEHFRYPPEAQQLSQPDGFFQHVRHHAGSIILYLVYGYHVNPDDDEYITWFPFAAFQKEAEIAGNDALVLLNVPFELTTKAMTEGRAETSFITKSLERLHASEMVTLEEKNNAQIVKNCAATVCVVLTTILAMIRNPAVQRKAHAELYSVVGRKRLPNFEDRPNLPFVDAMAAPIAHASRNDDVYDGYSIPGGELLRQTLPLAIMHDEENAEAFDPERICPGRHLAVDAAYIAIVSLLWAVTMSPAQDSEGRDIIPDVTYADGLILRYRLIARGSKHRRE
ncbi:cytochrome P450 [Hymenopellis radicata]|nr:cytochrome P450 [Hymenopellis radicata]